MAVISSASGSILDFSPSRTMRNKLHVVRTSLWYFVTVVQTKTLSTPVVSSHGNLAAWGTFGNLSGTIFGLFNKKGSGLSWDLLARDQGYC